MTMNARTAAAPSRAASTPKEEEEEESPSGGELVGPFMWAGNCKTEPKKTKKNNKTFYINAALRKIFFGVKIHFSSSAEITNLGCSR